MKFILILFLTQWPNSPTYGGTYDSQKACSQAAATVLGSPAPSHKYRCIPSEYQ